MPTMIYLANGEKLEVAEDSDGVASRLNSNSGLPVRFDVPYGDPMRFVLTYVNPSQVTHFEETPPFDAR